MQLANRLAMQEKALLSYPPHVMTAERQALLEMQKRQQQLQQLHQQQQQMQQEKLDSRRAKEAEQDLKVKSE
jgi:hypothetical protein